MNGEAADSVSDCLVGVRSCTPMNRYGFRGSVALLAVVLLLDAGVCRARDFVLTIGGGYSPEGNQVSLEKNVLLFQRMLSEQSVSLARNDIFFADGDAPGKDVQVHDLERLPEAIRKVSLIHRSRCGTRRPSE